MPFELHATDENEWKKHRGAKALYPFDEMDVGQCFYAPDDMGSTKGGSSKRQSSISTSCRGYIDRRQSDKKFQTTKMIRNGEAVIACRRVK